MKRTLFALIATMVLMSLALAQPTELTEFPIEYGFLPPGTFYDRGPLIADVTGDGKPEAIFFARDENRPSNFGLDRILVYNYGGGALHQLFQLQMRQDLDEDGYSFEGVPAVVDGDGDGQMEIVAGAWRGQYYPPGDCPLQGQYGTHWQAGCNHYHSKILSWEVVDEHTTQLTVSPPYGDFALKLTTPVVADVAGPNAQPADGLSDLLFLGPAYWGPVHRLSNEMGTSWENKFAVFVWNGSYWSLDLPTVRIEGVYDYNIDNWENSQEMLDVATPSVGDVTGDGIVDIFILWPLGAVSDNTQLAAFAKLTVLSGSTFALLGEETLEDRFLIGHTSTSELSAPVLVDANQDGALEAYFPVRSSDDWDTPDYIEKAYLDQGNWVYAERGLPATPMVLKISPGTFFAAGDGPSGEQSSPGGLDIYVPCGRSQGGSAFVWLKPDFTFGILQDWPRVIDDNDLAFRDVGWAPAISNTDANNDLELIVKVAGSDSGSIRNMKLSSSQSSDYRWQVGEQVRPSIGVPTVADFNGDGLSELMVITSQSTPNAQLHAYRTGAPYDPDDNQWNGYQNGPKHTGLYAQPVTGIQQLEDVKWSGRITIHETYVVEPGQTLTVEPGTVVEFMPNATLFIEGSLQAVGLEKDSVIFTQIGTERSGTLYLYENSHATIQYGKFHGLNGIVVYNPSSASIVRCHIFDMEFGINAVNASREALFCQGDLIENCSLYGICGSVSSGNFELNTVRSCSRAGIYWVGDRLADAARFYENSVITNGQGEEAIAGGYFDLTTANLQCNYFGGNLPFQIRCENQANIAMTGMDGGINELEAANTDIMCPSCYSNPFPQSYQPLMVIGSSSPQLKYGQNRFFFNDGDGVYLYDHSQLCSVTEVHELTNSMYSPDPYPPGPNNPHFCPRDAFVDPDPSEILLLCGVPIDPEPVEPPFRGFNQATRDEKQGNLQTARIEYEDVIGTYPASEEAIWSTRGVLRTGLNIGQSAQGEHDSLIAIAENTLIAERTRAAARREAVWALVAGSNWSNARTELQGMIADPTAQRDSLWAEVMLAAVDFLEASPHGSGKQAGTADIARLRQRVSSFQDRVHQIMGRQTDQDVLNVKAPVAESKDLSLAYPNPFNSVVNIRFNLREDARTKLDIFNVLGRKVATLADANLQSGQHIYQWTADNAATGVYFYRLSAGTRIETRKLLLLR